ncbi:MAG: hypothetical protein CEE38_23070 [Planctomycetes bacterium B3_Pla]|nr:MAG: hypothetical protein CEE38_23070 [Planctomycetes bacterium B3_Pla]
MTFSQLNNKGCLFYYIRKFLGLKGLVGLVAWAYPIIGGLLGIERRLMIPPLDASSLVIYVILFTMVVLVSYSLRCWCVFSNRQWMTAALSVVLFGTTIFCALRYYSWREKAIRCWEVQPENDKPKTVCVIIGLERTKFAKEEYEGRSDVYMLQKRGWEPEQVRLLWTPESLAEAKRSVMGYFLAIPLLVVGIVSLLVLRECIDDNWGSPVQSPAVGPSAKTTSNVLGKI